MVSPVVAEIERRLGQRPGTVIADQGYASAADIVALATAPTPTSEGRCMNHPNVPAPPQNHSVDLNFFTSSEAAMTKIGRLCGQHVRRSQRRLPVEFKRDTTTITKPLLHQTAAGAIQQRLFLAGHVRV